MKRLATAFNCLFLFAACQETPLQRADDEYNVAVSAPYYADKKPVLLFDEAHHNFHTTDGLYKPFVSLLMNDGFEIRPVRVKFKADVLSQGKVMVIANAAGDNDLNDQPAFSPDECEAVAKWVGQGGSLLLVADHFPFGSAAQLMASAFGVDFQKGVVSDSVFFAEGTGDHTQIVFSRANRQLKDHPVTAGVERVVIFTGQSLAGPPGATVFLGLSPHAYDMSADVKITRNGDDSRVEVNYADPKPAQGRAVGIAMQHGKGRVVVLGEAAMLTAQKTRDGVKVGMNSNEGNRRLVLNIMHWLVPRSS